MTLFLDNDGISNKGYILEKIYNGDETVLNSGIVSNTKFEICEFISPPYILNNGIVPSGWWSMNLFAKSNDQKTNIGYYFSIYRVDNDGVTNESILVPGNPENLTYVTSTEGVYSNSIFYMYLVQI